MHELPQGAAEIFADGRYRYDAGAEKQNYVAGEWHVESRAILTAMPDQPGNHHRMAKEFGVAAGVEVTGGRPGADASLQDLIII